MITLTTDFGDDFYVAQMKGVIYSINPGAVIVDSIHTVPPQSVIAGAYALSATVPFFPHAIHVGVVDPGVGTARKPLLFVCDRGMLVGPDNGLLVPAARRLGLRSVYELAETRFRVPAISATFHGRDIFAPVAAHLDRGISPDDVGTPVDSFVELSLDAVVEAGAGMRGTVLFVDAFGTLITSIPKTRFAEMHAPGDTLTVTHNTKKYTARYGTTYADAPPGTLIVLASSSDFMELAVANGSAASVFHAAVGDAVTIQ